MKIDYKTIDKLILSIRDNYGLEVNVDDLPRSLEFTFDHRLSEYMVLIIRKRISYKKLETMT